MSVIVKGMEMPKNCTGCPICCGLPYQHRDVKGRRPDCPLIELPPHGDLVDRNELLAEYDRQHEGEAGKARKIMEQAKAVIEGSET